MTSYDEIYGRFLSKINDDDIKSVMVHSLELGKNMLFNFLIGGISLYTYQTQELTQRDDENESFTISLTDQEKEILSLFMIVTYLTPKSLTTDLIEDHLTSKDIRQFSGANLLKEIRTTKESYYDKAHSLMTENYIRAGL